MLKSVVIPAYAKVNLYLDIVGVEENGYHLLEMVNSRISLQDEITCSLSNHSSINLTCSDSRIPLDMSNTAYFAAQRFRRYLHSKEGITIHIEKNIPHGAGLGGGSSDAAAVLEGLNELYNYPLNQEQLMRIGLSIGADVPFFLERGCCYIGGIGERTVRVTVHSSLKNEAIHLVLCSPDYYISTKEAYHSWDQVKEHKHHSPKLLLNDLIHGNREQIPHHLFNAFESVLYPLHSPLEKVFETFRSISPNRPLLSGSGSNLFALYLNRDEAEEVCQQLHFEGIQANHFELLLNE